VACLAIVGLLVGFGMLQATGYRYAPGTNLPHDVVIRGEADKLKKRFEHPDPIDEKRTKFVEPDSRWTETKPLGPFTHLFDTQADPHGGRQCRLPDEGPDRRVRAPLPDAASVRAVGCQGPSPADRTQHLEVGGDRGEGAGLAEARLSRPQERPVRRREAGSRSR